MNPPIVIFDLDGTLVDTAPDLVSTLNSLLTREGLPPVNYAEARNMVGGGARVMIERGLKAHGRTLPVDQMDSLVEDFVAHYAAHIADRSQPFPGVQSALDELVGYRLAVCTNKLEWLSVHLLETLGLASCFGAICGPDTFKVAKPDPEFLLATIARAGGNAGSAVMVGDSLTDIETARAAGIPIIAVDFGYTEIPVADLKPDRIVGALADLPRAISDLIGPPPAGIAPDH